MMMMVMRIFGLLLAMRMSVSQIDESERERERDRDMTCVWLSNLIHLVQ
jgi:hypothetical protein